jgi:alpha-mannosidase
VVREAYALNVPLNVAAGALKDFSAFSLDKANVFIDTVKPAEDLSGDIILRLYEGKKGDTSCTLALGIPASALFECDMLENKLAEVPVTDGKAALHMRPFEVKTLRLTQRG